MSERKSEHYSNKGGHKERSDFHKDVRQLRKFLQQNNTYNPRSEFIVRVPVEQAHLIRRTMFRDPRDGRR